MANQYGPLAEVVSTGGSLVAAAAALGLAWRGRTKWEPSEEDLPAGGQKVAGLLAAVAIALLWAENQDPASTATLNKILIVGAVGTFVSFLLYSFLIGTQTFTLPTTAPATRIIGGFRYTKRAKTKVRDDHVEGDELLEGFCWEVDKVWTRSSRQAAKTTCIGLYTTFVFLGTVTLAAAAVRIGLALQIPA